MIYIHSKKTLSFFCAWMIITPTLSIQRHLIWLKFSNKTNGFYCSLVVVVIFFILFILWFIKASKQTLWIFISELLDTHSRNIVIFFHDLQNGFSFLAFKHHLIFSISNQFLLLLLFFVLNSISNRNGISYMHNGNRIGFNSKVYKFSRWMMMMMVWMCIWPLSFLFHFVYFVYVFFYIIHQVMKTHTHTHK